MYNTTLLQAIFCALYVYACISTLARGKREREGDTFHGANESRTLATHGLPFPSSVLGLHVKICRRTWGVVTWENLLLSFPSGLPLTFLTSSPYLSLFLILTPLFSHRLRILALSLSPSHYRCHHFSPLCDDEMTLLSLSLNLTFFSSCLCAHSFCIVFTFLFIYLAYNALRNLHITQNIQ